MNVKKLENQYFVFASDLENPNKFFQGYCFVGTDYIFGDIGRQKYYDETGNNIFGGEDGCYVIAESVDDSFLLSSDFSGNKKIFYYWTPDFWVVSNSIFLIVEHLKDNNINISVNYSQLAAIAVPRGSFFNQLYSIDTFVNNIKLLPIGHSLKISKSRYSIEKIEKTRSFDSYEEGLSIFIGTWIARLAGLLNHGINIKADLTGGADSRTVFTFLKKAAEKTIRANNIPVLRSGSTPSNTTDLEIATKIANIYNFPINEKGIDRVNTFSGEESFLSWKILCLGVYHPVYFPNSGPQHHIVSLGGAGAENHRHFYKNPSVQDFVNSNASKVSPKWLSYNVIADLETELQRMTNANSEMDPLILHYREYRNRMHSGRTPQYISLFNPLGSKILEDVSEVAGENRLKVGQLNYDLMATLLPDILNIPFDNEAKALNEVRKENLTVLDSWQEFETGNVYIDNNPKIHDKEKTLPALQLLNIDFQKAKENSFVKEFFGTEFIGQAETAMADAIESKRFPHAIYAQSIAAIIAASLFD
ncbi:hypothetical protein NK638_01070 [Psychrobacter sp. A3]|uniref:hypothetical protein n=1 Tax=Psychrobacter sp. A3 TaxID=2992754 RepID=UPI00237ABE1A|nr:hypothetical protein [Psychrobacter sp. A3]MDE0490143.1 hypothetical protein [Psychrobacter sp. A3]